MVEEIVNKVREEIKAKCSLKLSLKLDNSFKDIKYSKNNTKD